MLRSTNNVKRGTAPGGTLSLEADSDKSFMVKLLCCNPSTNEAYLTARIERRTVAVFRAKGLAGNHVPYGLGVFEPSLMQYLQDKLQGELSIPVAAGETLKISRYAEAGDITIVYDEYDAGDIQNTLPNGSHCKQNTYLQYLTYDTAITAAGIYLLNSVLSPSEFHNFPVGQTVPGGHTMEVLGIAASPLAQGDGNNDQGTTAFLKMTHERQVLGDEDLNGYPFRAAADSTNGQNYSGNASVIGGLTANDLQPPMLFDKAVVCQAGDELNIEVETVAGTAANVAADKLDVALLIRDTKA